MIELFILLIVVAYQNLSKSSEYNTILSSDLISESKTWFRKISVVQDSIGKILRLDLRNNFINIDALSIAIGHPVFCTIEHLYLNDNPVDAIQLADLLLQFAPSLNIQSIDDIPVRALMQNALEHLDLGEITWWRMQFLKKFLKICTSITSFSGKVVFPMGSDEWSIVGQVFFRCFIKNFDGELKIFLILLMISMTVLVSHQVEIEHR